METKASHVLIGAFVLTLLAAAFGFVYWVKNATLNASAKSYAILFHGPVGGLSSASRVLFNGLPAGKVVKLAIYPPDTRMVEVIVQIDEDTPIRTNSRARIAQQGLTGLPAIMISAGTPQAALLAATADQPYIRIQADRAVVRPLFDAAPEVLGNAGATINRINDLIAENEQEITSTIANIAAFSKVLNDNRDDVAALLGQASTLASKFDGIGSVLGRAEQLITRLDRLVADNQGAVARSVRNVEAFTSELEQNKGEITGLLKDVRQVASELKGAGNVLGQAGAVVNRVNTLIGENEKTIQRSLANVESFTAMLEENRADVATIIGDVKSATAGLKGAGTVLDDVGATAKRINELVASNEEAIQTSLKNVEAFTSVLDRNRGEVDTIVADVKAISGQLRTVAGKMDTTLDRINSFVDDGEDGSLVDDLRHAVTSFRALAAKLETTVGDNAEGLTRTAKRSLYELELFMRDGRRAAQSLDRVLDKIERNPQSLIFGGSSVPEYTPSQ